MAPNDTVTASNGAPVNENASLTVGEDGPTLIQDFNLIDKLAHFDRERIPERVVHAKAAGAHGYYEVTHDISHLTCAKFLTGIGKRTPCFARISTVGGESGSADTARDPRGFAVKFYTEEGNCDWVMNNTPVFFIRDAIKFPDFIHTQKRDPRTNLKDPNIFWDFLSQNPESTHQVTILFSDRGTPASLRKMDAFYGHTLKMVNSDGKFKYVKFHCTSKQGKENFTIEEAVKIGGENPDYLTQDLFEHIEKGDYPEWTVSIQIMEPEDKDKMPFDIFDITKVWSKKNYPLHPIGRFILNKNPDNYFCEVEQSAFSPSHLVPGLDVTPDKMLQGRLFSYPDTHRHRLGVNYQQLPINRPVAPVVNHQRAGHMAFDNPGGRPNYPDSTLEEHPPKTLVQNNPTKSFTHVPEKVYGITGTYVKPIKEDIDFYQAGELWKVMSETDREHLVHNIAIHLGQCKEYIRTKQIGHFKRAHPDYGRRVEEEIAKELAK
ncbi:hypothetical protein K450DRAFT_239755 [Umbelopsis ramanniana AG]|uniref:Catalase n=1 Tax=Umbelopsis ramanniana AG TaxID=1314678 RepID=A0AAD5EBI3_UMBRA|nr:uncharacterized protein K450DRAFT_239755 [Umbelopsis ramanniana AG]KAI8579926.1 hypothetical protein K450DRAFT_239755 [Umbelopsis ramanniana AG]